MLEFFFFLNLSRRAAGFIYRRRKKTVQTSPVVKTTKVLSLLSPHKVPRPGKHPTVSLVRDEVDKARHTQLLITKNTSVSLTPDLPRYQSGERGGTPVRTCQLGYHPREGEIVAVRFPNGWAAKQRG
jgi:hypothetical protein